MKLIIMGLAQGRDGTIQAPRGNSFANSPNF